MRRTSAIDTTWPDGFGGPMRMTGQARDLFTSPEGEGHVVAAAALDALVTPERKILRLASAPTHANLQKLTGAQIGGRYRPLLADLFSDQLAASSLLYLLLDDLAGASLVASFAWSHWVEDRYAYLRGGQPHRADDPGKGALEGVCAGFRPGSSALDANGFMDSAMQNTPAVVPLASAQDPIGWHEIATQDGPGARRARRLDVWHEDGLIRINAYFQDSSTTPAAARVSQHEYLLDATADAATHSLLSLTPEARILPFPECLSASLTAPAICGAPLDSLRNHAPQALRGTLGCTHLNDVLRALADAPALARTLRQH